MSLGGSDEPAAKRRPRSSRPPTLPWSATPCPAHPSRALHATPRLAKPRLAQPCPAEQCRGSLSRPARANHHHFTLRVANRPRWTCADGLSQRRLRDEHHVSRHIVLRIADGVIEFSSAIMSSGSMAALSIERARVSSENSIDLTDPTRTRGCRPPLAERCPSDRTGRSRKPLRGQPLPGFESLSLRHLIRLSWRVETPGLWRVFWLAACTPLAFFVQAVLFRLSQI